jgi:hypothetical protein
MTTVLSSATSFCRDCNVAVWALIWALTWALIWALIWALWALIMALWALIMALNWALCAPSSALMLALLDDIISANHGGCSDGGLMLPSPQLILLHIMTEKRTLISCAQA